MNTALKTTSDASNRSDNLQSVNDYGLLHREITTMNEHVQKMHICQAAYIASCYAEACAQSSSELQKKQTEEAVTDEGNDDSVKKNPTALHEDIIKNLMHITAKLQSCHYVLYEKMHENCISLAQIMSLQQIEQCKDWLINIPYRSIFNELKPLIDINKISKKIPVQQVIQWMHTMKRKAMELMKLLNEQYDVPCNRSKYKWCVKNLEQANINIIQQQSEMMALAKPKQCHSVNGWTYSFDEKFQENNMITMVYYRLHDVRDALQKLEYCWERVLIQHDVLSDPREVTDVAVQLKNNPNQFVRKVTQVMPLSEMKFSSDYLANAFQEQMKAEDSVSDCLANAFRQEQQDRAENSVKNQARNDKLKLEGYIKEIFELEARIISMMAAPMLKSFADYKCSIALIKEQVNVIKNTCRNVMNFIQDIPDRPFAPFSHLTTAQKQDYYKLCDQLPRSLNIIKNECRKLCYSLHDKKNKGQEISEENIEEMKNWREESSIYLDISNHINMLQGQLACINEESVAHVLDKRMRDLLKKISYYELKANDLMTYHINRLYVS